MPTFKAIQMNDFLLQSYDYPLPKTAIAYYPASPRESAKLLVYERASGRIIHSDFFHFCDFVPNDTLIVFNNTRVIKARIYAHKLIGELMAHFSQMSLSKKRYEIFYHKCINRHFLVQIKGRVKEGDWLLITQDNECNENIVLLKVLKCLSSGLREVQFYDKDLCLLHKPQVLRMLETRGHIPLPPYIRRNDTLQDANDYQTVFAKTLGAVAAPTASLHFGLDSMQKIMSTFDTCFLTLHIGAGTFQSVESQDVRLHVIHTESFLIPKHSAKAIDNAKNVLCVGTTCARAVEYYARYKVLRGECDIFLYPSVAFKRVDYLLTNFHLPKSSLLMLVSAMIGREKCLEIYQIALKCGYKFYSYGDGMLII